MSELAQQVCNIIKEELGCDFEVTPAHSLDELTDESLEKLKVALSIEDALGIVFPKDKDIFEMLTVQELINTVRELKNATDT